MLKKLGETKKNSMTTFLSTSKPKSKPFRKRRRGSFFFSKMDASKI
jgi:hypothetical protein